ncbi:cytochrome c oxidase assembly protein [Rhodovibrio salinarum]|uniref:Cytochrome c oxidase assembly protein CtaG n=1 Tax=Rhodovibrio salinarum TaxID=1087 RepID=A0A934QIE5_9PROT|nr:cytochrome c oxidase assembly protein [Rhodovibrio salinarum]MBK1697277.1 cytochrome c oxidase assembly protein [Rhodovibrio salinarum]
MATPAQDRRRTLKTVLPLIGILCAMGVLMYYAVPLYNMFCQVTGIGGTTQRATAGQAVERVDREITVQFATQVQPDLPWEFWPEQRKVTIDLGERKTVYFRAKSNADRAIVGHAAYNVTPLKVGKYVNKIQCFCFTEEKLDAGESVRMPVELFVSPQLAKDVDTDEVRTVTLSYTFFESTNPDGAKDLKRLDTPAGDADADGGMNFPSAQDEASDSGGNPS